LSPASAAAAGLNLFPELEYVALNVVVFLLLVWPTNRFVIQPLLGVLRAREDRTDGALARAEEQVGETARLSDDVRARLRAARDRAQGRRAEIAAAGEGEVGQVLAQAREEGARTIASVRDGIAEELAAARTMLETETRALASDAAAKILGRSL